MALSPETHIYISIAEGVAILGGLLSFSFLTGRYAQKVETIATDITAINEAHKEHVDRLNEHAERISRLEGGQE